MSTKKINIIEPELMATRISKIASNIKILAANKNIHAQRVASTYGDKRIVFCVTDNARIANLSQFDNISINERFKTINPRFTASYYEMWNKVLGTKNEYSLLRIYFHLYLREEDTEFILLHTDPLDSDIHGNYKRSPHLHIKATTDDVISHAHFALNITDYDTALSSIEELNRCFKLHIEMLTNQIIIDKRTQ